MPVLVSRQSGLQGIMLACQSNFSLTASAFPEVVIAKDKSKKRTP